MEGGASPNRHDDIVTYSKSHDLLAKSAILAGMNVCLGKFKLVLKFFSWWSVFPNNMTYLIYNS